MTERTELFPPLAATRTGFLPVDGLHTLYWEEAGNPDGVPVVVLHGGPGANSSPLWRQFFDPQHYRVIQFDQRGCGQSQPTGELRDNTTGHLVADIDALRRHLGVGRWLVFGGSWGSTLALAYGQTYPQHCLGFILRSIFLCSAEEIAWYFENGRHFHPELYAQLAGLLPAEERGDLLGAYTRRLVHGERAAAIPFAQAWARFECARASISGEMPPLPDDFAWTLARIEAWYFSQRGFLAPGALLANMARLAGLPAVIVHGRQDMLCAPLAAFQLAGHYPGVRLHIVPDGAHTAFDPSMRIALLRAADQFRRNQRFD
jgi:proline iminopeptidase